MDYRKLYSEITADPAGMGYSGMSAGGAASALNAVDRIRTRTVLSSGEIYEQIDVAEFQGKTDAQRMYVRDILGLGGAVVVGPGSKARSVLVGVFGAGSATVTALAAALQESVSRAQELDLGSVTAGDVAKVRSWQSA